MQSSMKYQSLEDVDGWKKMDNIKKYAEKGKEYSPLIRDTPLDYSPDLNIRTYDTNVT